MFGSYAKGKNITRSDVDIIVIFKKDLINMEKNENIKKIKSFLEERFDSDVDVLDFTYAIGTFDESEMENLITLI